MDIIFIAMIIFGALDGLLMAYKYIKIKELSLLSRLVARAAFIIINIIALTQNIITTENLLKISVILIFIAGIVANVIYILGAKYRDTLEVKRLNRTLEQLKHKYKIALDSAPVGFYVLDASGRIEYANQKACDLLGYTQEDILNKPVFKVVADYDIDKVRKNIKERIQGRPRTKSYLVDLVDKSGKIVRTKVFSNQTINGHLTITGSIISVDDCDEEQVWMQQS